jgi:hypothetical protein
MENIKIFHIVMYSVIIILSLVAGVFLTGFVNEDYSLTISFLTFFYGAYNLRRMFYEH